MVPIVHQPPPVHPAWQQQQNPEAKQCQERIQCLEKALGFMQAELDRLNNQAEESKYDKISVWPQSMQAMIADWVNGNWRPSSSKQPPLLLPRSDSFRAKSVAPNNAGFVNAAAAAGDQRATSAPPAPPGVSRPFPPRR